MSGQQDRARAIVGRAEATKRGAAATRELEEAWLPEDLRALYACSDGLELKDGTRILPLSEVVPATAWLVAEKALEWGPELLVIGERDDLVIVRDTDPSGARAGGGVLEAATDGLSRLSREALDVVGYLEERLEVAVPDDLRAPERAARAAVARRDAEALALALERPFYPGATRELAHAALTLGTLRAARRDAEGALRAFGISVDARVRAAPRGVEVTETRAAWRACAVAAERAGSLDLADACRARAG